MNYRSEMQENLEEEANRLWRSACEKDDIFTLKEALAAALSTNSYQDVLQNSLLQCVTQRSYESINYLLDQGAHLEALAPSDIAGNENDKIGNVEALLKLLQLLQARGWDINHISLPQHNQSPILWHVTYSPILVQWCVDNGSELTVPNEIISIDPTEANIYHTPRHPLLLERVAEYGSISTFKMLLSKGAPIAPGKTWPAMQSPCLLDRAVLRAMQVAPELNQQASTQYKDRLDMIIYLLHELDMYVNGSRPFRASHVLFQDEAGRFRKSIIEHEKKREIQDLVDILLDAGASLDEIPLEPDNGTAPESSFQSLVNKDKDVEGDAIRVTEDRRVTEDSFLVSPLARVYLWQPAQFWHAVKEWQQRQSGIIISRSTTDSGLPGFQLSKLPNELLDWVGIYLNFSDVLSMRLVSRHVSNCMNKAFQHQIRTRKIDLRPAVLQDLIDQLTLGRLICQVEEIILTPRNVYTPGYYDLVQQLLTKFLTTSICHGKINSIQIQDQRNCHRLKDIMEAVSASGIILQSLSLYRGSGKYCAPTSVYSQLDLQHLAQSVRSVKHFHWTLAIDGYRGANAPRSTRTADTGSLVLKAIRQVLDMMPEVEDLDLFWFKKYPADHDEQYFFKTCYTSILAMKNLKAVGLTGLDLDEASLSQFLKSTNAKRVALIECRLIHGNWKSVFDTLTSGSFDYFHLEELYESITRLSFDVPGFKQVSTGNVSSGPSKITREGTETSRQFSYRPSGQIIDADISVMFEEERTRIYGSDNLRMPSVAARRDSP